MASSSAPLQSALFIPTGRELASSSWLAQGCSCLQAACIDPWRRIKLRIEGTRCHIDQLVIEITPSTEVQTVGPEVLAAYDFAWMWPWPPPPPPGLAVELSVPPHGRWALCSATEVERGQMLAALRDAIDLSHGAGSPFETWALGETLGVGTFGTVRAAQLRATGELAAAKVLSLSALDRQCDARKAVEREKRMMTRLAQMLPLRAPLVRLIETHAYGDSLYFFLSPRCDGDLLTLLTKGAFTEVSLLLPPDQTAPPCHDLTCSSFLLTRAAIVQANAAACTRVVLLAIAALHRAGVMHLDVKPQNLLYRTVGVSRRGPTVFDAHGVPAELLLADFGCARELSRTESHPADGGSQAVLQSARGGWRALRSDGGGTLYFTAPEILEEEVQATSADVWAAGCVAFSLLHRRPPFVYEGYVTRRPKNAGRLAPEHSGACCSADVVSCTPRPPLPFLAARATIWPGCAYFEPSRSTSHTAAAVVACRGRLSPPQRALSW